MPVEASYTLMEFSTKVRERRWWAWVLEQVEEILENQRDLSVDDVAGRGVWCEKNSTVLDMRMDFVAGM